MNENKVIKIDEKWQSTLGEKSTLINPTITLNLEKIISLSRLSPDDENVTAEDEETYYDEKDKKSYG
ncbi:33268_t:CDS:2 [Gigaspora margarita]|uniref:33268_t:CDS:1 n=1 Tax=Gigaspora margarita TaxID=4874 RepID=A0ABN7U9T6_GIGMA|nr:33268_t:CDS:2 [Gigaspora margarita]